MYDFMTQHFWKLTALLGIITTTACATLLYLRFNREKQQGRRPVPLKDVSTDTAREDEKPTPQADADEAMKAEARQKMEDFGGCFEPLRRVILRGTADSCRLILKDIHDRIRNFKGCEHLKAWMNTLAANQDSWDDDEARRKAASLMQLFKEAGLQQDERQQITTDGDTCSCYYHDELDELPVGETFKVKSPCWTFEGKVLEKGILV